MRSLTGRLLAAALLLPVLLTGHSVRAAEVAAMKGTARALQAPPQAPFAAAAPTAAPDAQDASPEEVKSYRILFQEEIYPYQVFAPRGYRTRPAGPAILLLHGVGGDGPWSIAAWKDLANEKGILLVAPTVPFGPQFEPLMPTLLRSHPRRRCRRGWKLDPRRVYLFGHFGAQAPDFSAPARDRRSLRRRPGRVHRGDLSQVRLDRWPRQAQNADALSLIGDRDEFFPLALARRTRDIRQAAGFPLHYVELPGHDHDYHAVAEQVNRDAWAFLSQYSLPD